MARRAGQVVAPFGHEGHRLAERVGDLLAAILEDHMVVTVSERVRIAEIELLLARSPLAL